MRYITCFSHYLLVFYRLSIYRQTTAIEQQYNYLQFKKKNIGKEGLSSSAAKHYEGGSINI